MLNKYFDLARRMAAGQFRETAAPAATLNQEWYAILDHHTASLKRSITSSGYRDPKQDTSLAKVLPTAAKPIPAIPWQAVIDSIGKNWKEEENAARILLACRPFIVRSAERQIQEGAPPNETDTRMDENSGFHEAEGRIAVPFDPEDYASDATLTTLLRLRRDPDHFQSPEHLVRFAQNAAKWAALRASRFSQDWNQRASWSPLQPDNQRQEQGAVAQAIHNQRHLLRLLSTAERDLLLARAIHGHSWKLIAGMDHISENAATLRYARIITKLRDWMAEEQATRTPSAPKAQRFTIQRTNKRKKAHR